MGNMGGMLTMVNRDYNQVVVVVVPWNKAGFGSAVRKPTNSSNYLLSHEMIL